MACLGACVHVRKHVCHVDVGPGVHGMHAWSHSPSLHEAASKEGIHTHILTARSMEVSGHDTHNLLNPTSSKAACGIWPAHTRS